MKSNSMSSRLKPIQPSLESSGQPPSTTMTTPSQAQPAYHPPPKESKRWIIPIVVAVIVVVVFAAIAAVFLMRSGTEPVKIISITREPENPLPGEKIMVTAVIENCALSHLDSTSYFGASKGGAGGSMWSAGDRTYKFEIGPFDDGAEVWYMIGATGYDGMLVVSDEYTIQIGHVERSDITSLGISNVHYSPENPQLGVTYVTVWADITSNVTISDVGIESKYFFPYGSGGGGGLEMKSGNTYEFRINLSGFNGGLPKGTKVFFRVVAQDESGNTAVSPTISFTIS